MRILVACHDLAMAGGLLRFERCAREWRRSGHEMHYVVFGSAAPQFKTEFPICDLQRACGEAWDVVMVPGQGFPSSTIEAFNKLTTGNFGLRVQHILNDQTFKHGFLEVNRHYLPDLVIFNSLHWPSGTYTEFRASKFMHLVGAVDSIRFSALPGHRNKEAVSRKKVIGTQLKGDSIPIVLAALAKLDFPVELAAYRAASADFDRYKTEIMAGRLRLLPELDEYQLIAFYRDCDLVVHCERHAGWANIVAEAMSCEVPVVCTQAGTLSIAEHLNTAWVIDNPSIEAIAEGIHELMRDIELRRTLIRNARARILNFTWRSYAADMIAALRERISD